MGFSASNLHPHYLFYRNSVHTVTTTDSLLAYRGKLILSSVVAWIWMKIQATCIFAITSIWGRPKPFSALNRIRPKIQIIYCLHLGCKRKFNLLPLLYKGME
jgi:hypothetical protein